jgi:hypothetical protein
MKLNHKIKINLLDFIKSGKFEFVTIGQNKEWLAANFPDPDFKTKPKNNSSCWGFGKIEFWFVDDELDMIFTDHLEYLNAGNAIELDKSIFNDQTKNKLKYVQSKLTQFDIDYHIRHDSNLEQIILTVAHSNVKLGFGFYDEQIEKDNYELIYIFLKSKA